MGEILHVVLPLPVPASVYGLVLLLAALNFKLVKLDDVKEVGTYLTGIFPLLFVPAAAGVMELWAEMGEMLLPILVAIIPVTVLVMVSAGKTTQALTGRKKNLQVGNCFKRCVLRLLSISRLPINGGLVIYTMSILDFFAVKMAFSKSLPPIIFDVILFATYPKMSLSIPP